MVFFGKDVDLPLCKQYMLDKIDIELFNENCFETMQCSKITSAKNYWQ